MRIGISVLSHSGQSIWQNGLGQNAIFLAAAFRRLPFVREVMLIDVGSERALPCEVERVAPGLRLVTQRDATDEVDVIVEMAGALDCAWLDLMRARGCKVVFCCCGQPYAALVEPAVFDRPGSVQRPDRCDEVWLLPKDRLSIPWMRTLHRCPVHIVPFVWSPAFLEARIAEIARHGVHYGYAAAREAREAAGGGLRVAIFEPNISVVKASSIPMLVCDEAWRMERGAVSAMHVLNTLHMKDHRTMLHLANSLDLVREHRATFHGRHDIAGFMGQHADAVVSHQWNNDQNYAYLDVLYGDYPLIHNSPWLADAGYYYPDFDADAGARQLLAAARGHDAALAAYRARSRAVFDAVDPHSDANLAAYAERLLALGARGGNA
ncbi:DUF2827 domain-containing protein [Paraburkholderia caballeronis]|uniref:DUF2827 domain-containing protein n=1 Tax=Paraburkholderia caballeronis TaxID=416943 RepID=UPI0010654BAF|nr:DUF2827 domain-containing protein [Paraburkholderia caballeronis]TDV15604.1 uncharacterized protein DUF2827 [Paraburkholderia caballeronis]TDV17859.1 uncharacterized protein DUF2827 [Paraburkholderia caballeronis]TDV26527.1 uncharacterized protein DUF2827 [Paraburkholderia caballeronis]